MLNFVMLYYFKDIETQYYHLMNSMTYIYYNLNSITELINILNVTLNNLFYQLAPRLKFLIIPRGFFNS